MTNKKIQQSHLKDEILKLNNITNERRLESKLLEYEKSIFILENIIKSSSDAIAALDIDFYFIKLNNAFINSFYKISRIKTKIGMNLNIIVADFPELRKDIQTAYHHSLSGNTAKIKIENDINNENAYYCYEIYFNPLIDEITQTIRGTVCIIKNISDYKLKQYKKQKDLDRLAKAARMDAIGEMASALAHEINQPLAAINIYSHSCLQHYQETNGVNHKLLYGLKQIADLSQHAGQILNKMNNFMREGELFIEQNDINTVIKQAITFMSHLKSEFKFNIQLSLDESLPPIKLDKVKIIQVILNLAQNSIEAYHEDKKANLIITITTSLIDNQFIEINFIDNGPGIPNEITEKIMKSYFTTKSHGTGLGLGICRTLIEAHGGKLYIKKSDNHGTNFAFNLPY